MIIGVLGGIGAGKSTVTRLFAAAGAETVDADAIAHESLELPSIRSALIDAFGSDVIGHDGKVDRRFLAKRVFSNPSDLKRLEDLVHPEVLKRIEVKLNEHERHPDGLLVLDVPLLADSPIRDRCDRLIFVEAAPGVRSKRIEDRGWAPEELERRENLQASAEAKRSLADHIIDNSGPLEETRRQVARLNAEWMEGARQGCSKGTETKS